MNHTITRSFGCSRLLARSAVLAMLALAPIAPAQEKSPQNASADAEDIAFANRLSKAFKTVASNVEPAVVHITSLSKVQPVSYDFFFRPVPQGPARLTPSSLGSGVIVSPDGLIVTNNHVVKGADALKAKLASGEEFDAKLIGRDELTDLAVIQIQPKDGKQPTVKPARFGNSEGLEVGEWVVAIGSPFGLSNTVTAGIVSAKGRSVTPRETGRAQEDFIQTDAAINPGNSGGPLLNLQGEIVGINSAIASRTGGYEGIGFAIPSNTARAVMENIIANGRVVRGFLGAQLRDATAEELDGKAASGAMIAGVVEDGPAEHAGLQNGDIVVRFRGNTVNESRLRNAIGITPPGSTADLDVLRAGKVKSVKVTLGDLNAVLKIREVPALGVSVQALTKERAREMGYRNVEGVIVTDVQPDGRAAAAELQNGDIIVSIDGSEVTNMEQFTRIVGSLDFNRGSRFEIIRGRVKGYLDVRD